MKITFLLAAVLLVAAGGLQAQDRRLPAAAAVASALPLVEGEVRKIDRARGILVLRHGDLPNLGMPPMTMGFDVADPALLEKLRVGQKVRFQAVMQHGKAVVTELHPAP